MLLSIVIPVFDAQRYVVRLLDSILTAGYDPSLVEIVLVDDGSNDASVDRIVGWMRTHDDVVARLVRQDNGGVSRARNNGLDHAEGEYVWFVDADDMLPQGVLTFLYRLLEDGHDFVSGGFVPVAEDDGMIWRGGYSILDRNRRLPRNVWCYVVRRRMLLDRSIRFDEGLAFGEDLLWTWQVSHSSDDFLCVSTIYGYRDAAGSLMKVDSQEKLVLGARSMVLLAQRYMEQGDTEELRRRVRLCAQQCLIWCTSIDDRHLVTGLISKMKAVGVYPYNIMWFNLVPHTGFRQMIDEWISLLFPFEPYFWLVYNMRRRRR